MNGSNLKTSGSQRSIYDYPEHLNPFYEDENHKRLRFWKLGNDKSNRSSSFSIDGLKGFWSFKTFKLKKRSSTLGINKTSESPPMLRKQDNRFGSQATIDGTMRHTIDIGLSNNFQRGVPGRSSLQDLNSASLQQQGGNLFIRNNRYRSTVQARPNENAQLNRYQSNSTIEPSTPVFRSRYNRSTIHSASSQLSVNSNPFDNECERISQVGSPERASIRRPSRKKRPAPLPPVPMRKDEDVHQEVNSECAKQNETVNISNLTAEIESFVRTADRETIESEPLNDVESRNKEMNISQNIDKSDRKVESSRESPENNNFYKTGDHSVELTIEKIQNLGETNINCNENERCKTTPIKILIRAPTDEETLMDDDEMKTCSDQKQVHDEDSQEKKEDEQLQFHSENHLDGGKCTVDSENPLDGEKSELVPENHLDGEKHTVDSENHIGGEKCKVVSEDHLGGEKCEVVSENRLDEQESTVDSEIKSEEKFPITTNFSIETIVENDMKRDQFFQTETELKIVESSDILPSTKTDNNSATKVDVKLINSTKDDKFEVRYIPLKFDSTGMNKKSEAGGVEKETRRRSVKEIIESINKCQSLLKFNQNFETNKTEKDVFQSPSSSKSFENRNFNSDINVQEPNAKEYQNKRLFSEAFEENNNTELDDMSNIPVYVERFSYDNSKNDNNSNFVLHSEKKFSNQKPSNVEWNPVPKPRRHNTKRGLID